MNLSDFNFLIVKWGRLKHGAPRLPPVRIRQNKKCRGGGTGGIWDADETARAPALTASEGGCSLIRQPLLLVLDDLDSSSHAPANSQAPHQEDTRFLLDSKLLPS